VGLRGGYNRTDSVEQFRVVWPQRQAERVQAVERPNEDDVNSVDGSYLVDIGERCSSSQKCREARVGATVRSATAPAPRPSAITTAVPRAVAAASIYS
jgi:hypothetical protein